MKLPPTAEQHLVKLEEDIVHKVTRPLFIRPEQVYTVFPRECIRHLLWLGPARYDEADSFAGVQPWLDRVHARVVAIAAERTRTAYLTLDEIRETIYEESDSAEAVYQTRHRGAAGYWILRGIGEGNPDLTEELVDSFLDGICAQITEEANEARAQRQQEHYAQIDAEWRAARARGENYTPTASTAASERGEAEIDASATD
eukprot:GHVU01222889.1.p1 GENE.GHVU01222889.1~~GHVU01222889.1.p1  ORF type:complete len:201 (-),score=28.53 GHVU01222889.1:150-752(-)